MSTLNSGSSLASNVVLLFQGGDTATAYPSGGGAITITPSGTVAPTVDANAMGTGLPGWALTSNAAALYSYLSLGAPSIAANRANLATTWAFYLVPNNSSSAFENKLWERSDNNATNIGELIGLGSNGIGMTITRSGTNLRVGTNARMTSGAPGTLVITHDGTMSGASAFTIYINGASQTLDNVSMGSGTSATNIGETLYIGSRRWDSAGNDGGKIGLVGVFDEVWDATKAAYFAAHPLELVVAAAPGVPISPVASSIGSTTFSAGWTAPATGGTPTGYDVEVRYRATSSAAVGTYAAATGSPVGAVLTLAVSNSALNGQLTQFRVRAKNSAGDSAWVESAEWWQINDSISGGGGLPAGSGGGTAPTITSLASASCWVGGAFIFNLTATGTAPVILSTSALPAGITFNAATGAFSGIVPAVGAYTWTNTATNGTTPNAVQAFTLTVTAAPAMGGGNDLGQSLSLPAGTVSLALTSLAGVPVAGVRVAFVGPGGGAVSAASDAAGLASVAITSAGTYLLQAVTPGTNSPDATAYVRINGAGAIYPLRLLYWH